MLGLCDGHDAGACLARDGLILHAVSEERLTRRKRQPGFPRLALQECLTRTGTDPRQIELVAVAERAGRAAHRLLDRWYRRTDPNLLLLRPANRLSRNLHRLVHSNSLSRGLDCSLARRVLVGRLCELGVSAPLELVDHHQAHLASALMWSGLSDPLLLSLDAYGDGSSGAAALFDPTKNALVELERFPMGHSPAQFFGAMASLLGFPEGEEGKVTALAPSGEPSRALAILQDGLGPAGELLVGRLISKARRALAECGPASLAAAAQALIERNVGALAARLLAASGRRELALAGGLFANVGLNRALSRLPGVARMFVFPHMGDGGLCAGAAALALLNRGERPAVGLNHVFLGAGFDQYAINRTLVQAGVAATRSTNHAPTVAGLLERGKVVGLFQGRAEFGPRALGHRSVLFNARRRELPGRVSQMLRRDPLMPFAPCSLDERCDGLYDAAAARDCGRFMTCAFGLRPGAAELLPNGVHADATARAQSVGPEPAELRALLELVPTATLINTSFNLHREPIVHAPEDALRTFAESGLDALWMGESLVVRA